MKKIPKKTLTRKEKSELNKAKHKESLKKIAARQSAQKILQEKEILENIAKAQSEEQVFGKILEEIRSGKTVRSIFSALGQDRSKLYAYCKENPDYDKRYKEALEIGCESQFDEIGDIAHEIPREIYDAQGNRVYDKSDIEWKRLRIDAAKWTLAKKMPKKYGDKLELGGDPTSPMRMTVEWKTSE